MTKLINAIFLLIAVLFISCGNDKTDSASDNAKRSDTSSVTFVNPTTNINPYAEVDLSPLDLSYFPVEYPKLKMSKTITTPPVMRVVYSRPHRGGRTIFGSLLKYGEPWRLGANETSELETFQTVTIQGKKVEPARYLIYCIPYKDKWTVILNSNIYTWGLHIDSTYDLMKFDIPVQKTALNFEFFTMVFEKTEKGANLIMAWDDTEGKLPIEF